MTLFTSITRWDCFLMIESSLQYVGFGMDAHGMGFGMDAHGTGFDMDAHGTGFGMDAHGTQEAKYKPKFTNVRMARQL
jgi:hypothetical protein